MFEIEIHPVGKTDRLIYEELLTFLIGKAEYFSLTLQLVNTIDVGGRNVINELVPYKITETISQQWPGTIIFDSEAVILKYRFSNVTRSILRKYSSSIFDWVQPLLPEDICFYRSDNSVILDNIAHEKSAMLYLTEDEVKTIHLEFKHLSKFF